MADRKRAADSTRVAQRIVDDLNALPIKNTPAGRAIRKRYSRELKTASAADVIGIAKRLIRAGWRWVGYELITNHPAALGSLGRRDVEVLGDGISSWDQVDTFAIYISGPAWRNRQISDRAIMSWARSADRWWRRAALVSTVPLNARAQGGSGDVRRTLTVCSPLARDRDDMIVKALSWALRALIEVDREAVKRFLQDNAPILAARVMREVRNKLHTGLKNPRR